MNEIIRISDKHSLQMRRAFTGAVSIKRGFFEQADGGTIFKESNHLHQTSGDKLQNPVFNSLNSILLGPYKNNFTSSIYKSPKITGHFVNRKCARRVSFETLD